MDPKHPARTWRHHWRNTVFWIDRNDEGDPECVKLGTPLGGKLDSSWQEINPNPVKTSPWYKALPAVVELIHNSQVMESEESAGKKPPKRASKEDKHVCWDDYGDNDDYDAFEIQSTKSKVLPFKVQQPKATAIKITAAKLTAASPEQIMVEELMASLKKLQAEKEQLEKEKIARDAAEKKKRKNEAIEKETQEKIANAVRQANAAHAIELEKAQKAIAEARLEKLRTEDTMTTFFKEGLCITQIKFKLIT